MADGTKISWTDATWSPVSGCSKVSEGCRFCYAEALSLRFGRSKLPWTAANAPENVVLHPGRLGVPLRWRKPRRVFVCSVADLFHEEVPEEFIRRVFAVMRSAPQHTFQILTKRAKRMRDLLSRWYEVRPDGHGVDPLANVWVGVSVENEANVGRIDDLVRTPAAIRFVSAEPLLGPVDFSRWMPLGRARWQCSGCRTFFSGAHQEICPRCGRSGYWSGSHAGNGRPNGQPLSWIIVGGESGPHMNRHPERWMRHEWARAIRDQCAAAGVAYFFKQSSGVRTEMGTALEHEDGTLWQWHQWPGALTPSVCVGKSPCPGAFDAPTSSPDRKASVQLNILQDGPQEVQPDCR